MIPLEASYTHHGFRVIPGLLTPEVVQRARQALADILASRLPEVETRRTIHQRSDGSTYWNFYDVLEAYRGPHIGFSAELPRTPGLRLQSEPGVDLSRPPRLEDLRKVENHHVAHPFLFDLAVHHPKVLAEARSALGDEPVLYSCMALLKPPGGVAKPWHQDAAYCNVLPLTGLVGLWIALTPTTCENGCMIFETYGHGRVPLRHVHRADCEIEDTTSFLELSVPLAPGDAIVFSSLIPHRTNANSTAISRLSLQLHYRGEHACVTNRADYDVVFSDAKGPAGCFPETPKEVR
jgi:phytanoyl-CoA hydroxylase